MDTNGRQFQKLPLQRPAIQPSDHSNPTTTNGHLKSHGGLMANVARRPASSRLLCLPFGLPARLPSLACHTSTHLSNGCNNSWRSNDRTKWKITWQRHRYASVVWNALICARNLTYNKVFKLSKQHVPQHSRWTKNIHTHRRRLKKAAMGPVRNTLHFLEDYWKLYSGLFSRRRSSKEEVYNQDFLLTWECLSNLHFPQTTY